VGAELFDWIVQHLDRPIQKISMLVKKSLHFQELSEENDDRSDSTQGQIKFAESCLRKVSDAINESYFLLEGRHLNLGIKTNRKLKHLIEPENFELKGEVTKLANTCLIISQFMSESNTIHLT
jgi:hypothetical protein